MGLVGRLLSVYCVVGFGWCGVCNVLFFCGSVGGVFFINSFVCLFIYYLFIERFLCFSIVLVLIVSLGGLVRERGNIL